MDTNKNNSYKYDLVPLSDWGLVAEYLTELLMEEKIFDNKENFEMGEIIERGQELYQVALKNITDDEEKEFFQEMFH